MATISDVAKEAGVSVAAVSRYLNDGPISAANQQKIAKAIEKLSYQPNLLARALNTRTSKTVGFIVPNITNSFFTELYKYIDDIAWKSGYHIVLCNAETIEKEKEFINLLIGIHSDGIITATGNCAEIYSKSVMNNIPIVSVDRVIDNVPIHICSNNYKGGQIAAKHLYDCGCKKVAFIGAKSESESQHYRRTGFFEKCESLSMDASVFLTEAEDAKDAIDDLQDRLITFDGIFAWNDYVAVQLLNSFHKTGIKIPDDAQLIGFDNTYLGSIFIPALTTISQNIYGIAEKAMESLANAILGNGKYETKILVDVELIQRSTTISKKHS